MLQGEGETILIDVPDKAYKQHFGEALDPASGPTSDPATGVLNLLSAARSGPAQDLGDGG